MSEASGTQRVSTTEPLICACCGKRIIDEDKAIYSHKTGNFYCSEACKQNLEPMDEPTTGHAANTRGGKRQSRRGADIRWEITQSQRIADSELTERIDGSREDLVIWLKRRVSEDQHHLIDAAAAAQDDRQLLHFRAQVIQNLVGWLKRRVAKDQYHLIDEAVAARDYRKLFNFRAQLLRQAQEEKKRGG